jgi:dTDP-4-amino-4,6-dideoxygalactose transaminase
MPAQAHGARYNGRRAGSFGHAAAFSFYPSKNLGALGDGGHDHDERRPAAAEAAAAAQLRPAREVSPLDPGTNSRLDTLQAAVLSIKLPHLDGWNAATRRHADAYAARLAASVNTPSPRRTSSTSITST